MGLTLLEGQCRPITDDVLRIVDRDNLSEVSFIPTIAERFKTLKEILKN